MEAKKTTIQFIKEAANKLKDCKMKRLTAPHTQSVIEGVMKGVGLKNIRQAMLFVPMFDNSCRCRNIDLYDIANYLDCSTLDIIDYVPELNDMMKSGFIRTTERECIDIMRQSYAINEDVLSAIIEGKVVSPSPNQQDSCFDKYDFCKMVSNLVDNREVTLKSIIAYVNKKESECEYLKFIKDVCSVVSNVEDRILFYDMCNDYLGSESCGNGETHINLTMADIYEHTNKRIACKKTLLNDSHPLIIADLIMNKNTEHKELILTEKGKRLFFDEDIVSFSKSYFNLDRYSFAQAIYDCIRSDNFDKDNNRADIWLQCKVVEIEQANPQLQFISNVSKLIPETDDRIQFYMVCQKCIKGETLDLVHYLDVRYRARTCNEKMKLFKSGNHILLKTNLVELNEESGFFGDWTYLKCTSKGKDLFFEEDAQIYQEEEDTKDLLISSDIQEKHLFFSSELSGQLSMVQESLQDESYQRLKERLQTKALPKGIAVLMYGLPGTGKIESVLQIARATGRNIMKVDISATKSAWFGESEKIIKKVFTDYRYLCEKSSLTPILLFNEADAIFSKRKDVGSGNLSQTENAIQNILLEEIEKLEGILIATTNLADNLDAAFERRFLFKIRFDKPTLEAKQNIWMDKIPVLLLHQAKELARNYEFSGGEIENIVRKAMMREVIAGESPTIAVLHEYCREEKIAKNDHHPRVGFK